MSLAADLRSVLERVSLALRSTGVHDVAVMTAQAARILHLHVTVGEAEVAEDAAIRLIDHLFRGSAAAGAINSMPPPPAEPEPEPEPEVPADPQPEPAAPDSTPPVSSPVSSAPADGPVQVTTAALPPEPDTHMATPAEVTGAAGT